jgi:hypothetical protein
MVHWGNKWYDAKGSELVFEKHICATVTAWNFVKKTQIWKILHTYL